MRVPFGVWVVAGVLVGAAAATALAVSGVLDDDPAPSDPVVSEAEQRAEVVDEFVGAWERSRLGTYVAVSTFRRTFTAGGTFTADRVVAQRPPDRLERTFGSIDSRLDGRVVLCRTTGGRYRCEASRARRSYRATVAAEVAALRTSVDGPLPLYSVAADDDCFDLDQQRPLPAPPYGTSARFCFDADTGAISLIRIERDEAVDVTEATSVRATVGDRDLQPPGDGDRSTSSSTSGDGG